MRKIYVISALFIMGIMFQSCEKEEISEIESLKVNSANATGLAATDVSAYNLFFKENSVQLGQYVILFKGSSNELVDGKVVSTTFNYSLSGTGTTAQLDSFYIGVPGCAGTPTSWSPSQSAKLEGNLLKWNSSVSKDGAQDYSITYSGDIDYGLVEAIVVRGGVEYSGKVVGPCAGAYDLSGYVFVDANGDEIKGGNESGLPNYTVVLEQGSNVAEFTTGADGFYSFRVLPGDYNVSVKNNPLNEKYYTATSGQQSVSVPSAQGADFGYNAISSKLIEDFSNGQIILTTASAKDWGQAIKMAGKNNSNLSVQKVKDLLTAVDELLPGVYTFDFGPNRIQGALDILTKPIKTDEDLFFQQLLAAELNYVYGRGAVKDGALDDDFNLALIKYAEAKATEGAAAANSSGFSIMATTSTTRSLSGSSSLLSSFNDNGSGGL